MAILDQLKIEKKTGYMLKYKEGNDSFLTILLERCRDNVRGEKTEVTDVQVEYLEENKEGRYEIVVSFFLPQKNEQGFFCLNAGITHGIIYEKFSSKDFAACLRLYYNPASSTEEDQRHVIELLARVYPSVTKAIAEVDEEDKKNKEDES